MSAPQSNRITQLLMPTLAGLVAVQMGLAGWYLAGGDVPPLPALVTDFLAPPVAAQQAAAAAPTADEELPQRPVEPGSLDLEILRDVEKRQSSLDDREKELDRREERLNALDGDLNKQIVELKALQAKIEEQIALRTDLEDAAVNKLAKTYASMDPANAAQLLSQLDRRIAVRVLSGMKERNAATILDAMPAALASDLSERMVKRRP
jgi:flagellar motility protein MotE (MotC chaperone)